MVLSARRPACRSNRSRGWCGPSRRAGRCGSSFYLQGERGLDLELVRRAEAAGYEALVLTVDAGARRT